MTLPEVPVWATFRGVGHAVVSQGTFTLTACRRIGNGFRRVDVQPRRICRRCRRAIEGATLTGKGDER